MTIRLARPCLLCGRRTRNPSRCDQCAPVKAPTAARGYDSAWREVRAAVLQRDRYRCRWCGGDADTVDHLVPLAHGGPRLDPANLAAACRPCNSRRGATTRRARPVHATRGDDRHESPQEPRPARTGRTSPPGPDLPAAPTHHKGRPSSENPQVVTLLQANSQLHTPEGYPGGPVVV